MTRAKTIKSIFRMATTSLYSLNIPLIAINHTYKTLEMFSKDVISGGSGHIYNADNAWIIGRRQDKDGKVIEGYEFIINVDKSRFVKEKSKIPISVAFGSGINKWSGLFEIALEGNFITESGKGFYLTTESDKKQRKGDIEEDSKYWTKMLNNKEFIDYVTEKYKLKGSALLQEDTDTDLESNEANEIDE